MKFYITYSLILFLTEYLTSIKSEDSSYSILDMELNSIDDKLLNSFKDFEFVKDKHDTLNIRQKMKKVACLNIVIKAIKESKADIINQLKAAKEENKNNFNKFINNMTNTCIKIIKEKDIKEILNHENFAKKKFPLNKKDIKFEEHLEQFFTENERIKKVEEMELIRLKRNKIISNTIFIGSGVLLIFCIFSLLRKKRNTNKIEENNTKKTGNKKKKKKNE